MFDKVRIVLNNGIYKWILMFANSLLRGDFSFIGVAIIVLPFFRKLVNIFKNLF